MITKQEAEKRARSNWAQWRLLLSDLNITYSDLNNMDQDDVAEANAVLDIYEKAQKKNNKK